MIPIDVGDIFTQPKYFYVVICIMFCPECGAKNQDAAQTCISCGFNFSQKSGTQSPASGTDSNSPDTIPRFESLAAFLSALIPTFAEVKELVRKNLLTLLIPAIIVAIIAYFGLYNHIIYLIATLGEGINGGMSSCVSAAGPICAIAGFSENASAMLNAFSLMFGSLFLAAAFVGTLAGTIQSMGISRYLTQASGVISSLSKAIGSKDKNLLPLALAGTGTGFLFGSLLAGTMFGSAFITLPMIGLLLSALVPGANGLLIPVIQYAHRDIARNQFGQDCPRLISPGLVSVGISCGVVGYAVASFLMGNNVVIGIILGILLLGAGVYMLSGKGGSKQIPVAKLAQCLVVVLVLSVLVPAFVPSATADDGGTVECAGQNWDTCAGSDAVKGAASADAAAGAAGAAAGVVVGGAASLAARAAAMAKARKDALKGKDDDGDGPIGYILQLTKDSLTVGMDKSDSFTASVWKVEKDGSYTLDSSAPIEISASDVDGLSLSGTYGTGSLPVTVSLSKPSSVTSASLTVSASAGGKDLSAGVSITIEASMQVGFE